MSHSQTVRFVDTSYRDGHASLWAERMPTAMMLDAADEMDHAGFVAMEVIGTSHFKKCVRELKEDPWERIRRLAAALPHTPLAAMTGNHSPAVFGIAPTALTQLYFRRLAVNGIRRIHLMEPSNDFSRVETVVRTAQAAGLEVVLALVYTLSPRHTDRYYVEKAQDGLRLGVDRLYLKDPGGLLTPDRVGTLVPALMQAVGDRPLELHSHGTTGLAPVCYTEAMRLGIAVVHTGIPPLARGSAQPSLFNTVHNARVIGRTPQVNVAAARRASARLTAWAEVAGFPPGRILPYDAAQYVHQVPGGVISNLRHQLEQIGLGNRLPEVLAESVEVRRELGYPIMVTPFSQFVVSQAAIHVLTGQRYRQVSDELILYALGAFGRQAAEAMEPAVREQILGRRRAEELAARPEQEPSLEAIRSALGGPHLDDDELILRYIMGGAQEIERMRQAGGTPLGAAAG